MKDEGRSTSCSVHPSALPAYPSGLHPSGLPAFKVPRARKALGNWQLATGY
ncbi:MAG: hypothetical protein ACXW5U_20120 [Thermoanaerobaculia bacterium]